MFLLSLLHLKCWLFLLEVTFSFINVIFLYTINGQIGSSLELVVNSAFFSFPKTYKNLSLRESTKSPCQLNPLKTSILNFPSQLGNVFRPPRYWVDTRTSLLHHQQGRALIFRIRSNDTGSAIHLGIPFFSKLFHAFFFISVTRFGDIWPTQQRVDHREVEVLKSEMSSSSDHFT